jgi:hypothetical protein
MLVTQNNEAFDLRKKIDSKYQEVNDIWNDIKIPYITREEAEKAKNILIRKFGAKKFLPPSHSAMNPKAYRVWKPYICLSGDPTTLWKGWRRLIHSLSHKVYRRRFPQRWFDHSYQQAELEFEMCKFVIDSGWLNGTLKSKVIILSKDEIRNKKLEKYKILISKWERKFKTATSFIKKYNKKIKYLTK